MNTKYEESIVTTLVIAFAVIVLLQIYIINTRTVNGDMNNDGELTIVDLSILAEVIRNEP